MNNPSTILAIADCRLREAEILSGAGEGVGAIYLAGYSLELALKAKICERLDIVNLFDDDFASSIRRGGVSGMSFQYADDFRKFFKVHDLAKLLLLTGLRNKFDLDKANDATGDLMNAWTCICGAKWSENLRYLHSREKSPQEAENFIHSVKLFRQWLSMN